VAPAAEQVAAAPKAVEEPETEGHRLGRALRRAGMRSDREPISSRRLAGPQAKAKAEAKTRTDVKARAKAKGKPAPAVPCAKCKEEIPEGELICPACGANRPRKGRMMWLWILMPTLVLVLGLFGLAVFTEMLDPLVKGIPGVNAAVEKTKVFFGEKGWIKLPAPPTPGAPQK
jgi:predicted nucleic acid-binding Zn ribbon protein